MQDYFGEIHTVHCSYSIINKHLPLHFLHPHFNFKDPVCGILGDLGAEIENNIYHRFYKSPQWTNTSPFQIEKAAHLLQGKGGCLVFLKPRRNIPPFQKPPLRSA